MIITLEDRVVRRFLAREFATPEALQEYLHEHPKADPANHEVVKGEKHGKPEKSEKARESEKHEDAHEEEGGGGMLGRLKGSLKSFASKLKDAPADVQKFVADPKHRKEAVSKGVAALKKAPEKYVKQLIKTAKHEVHEFKTAGQGIAAVMKGNKPSAEQKKAIKAVAIHMAITTAAAILTTATPALMGMAMGKAMGKHVALKAATSLLGDLHVLEEMGHIGHGLAHVLQHIKFSAEQGGKGNGEKVTPEEALAALVMKHVTKHG